MQTAAFSGLSAGRVVRVISRLRRSMREAAAHFMQAEFDATCPSELHEHQLVATIDFVHGMLHAPATVADQIPNKASYEHS